jgi:hypothetical protein
MPNIQRKCLLIRYPPYPATRAFLEPMKPAIKTFSLSQVPLQVTDQRNGQMQVIAWAGTGKTEPISGRDAALITEGAEPTQILGVTFTERATETLKAHYEKGCRVE